MIPVPTTALRSSRRPSAVVAAASVGLTSVVVALAFGLSVGTAVAARTAPRVSVKADIGGAVQLLRPFVVETARSADAAEYERGMQAMALLRIRPQDAFPGWTVSFRKARSGLLGVTLVQERRVEIYVRLNRPITGTAHDLAHELGHVTDVTYNDDQLRAHYLALRNRPLTTPWWTCSGCGDMQVGAGDFAETFAMWAAPRFRFYSELAPVPSDEAMTRFARLLPSNIASQNPADADPEAVPDSNLSA